MFRWNGRLQFGVVNRLVLLWMLRAQNSHNRLEGATTAVSDMISRLPQVAGGLLGEALYQIQALDAWCSRFSKRYKIKEGMNTHRALVAVRALGEYVVGLIENGHTKV